MSNQFIASSAFEWLWQKVTPWFGANVLQLEKEITTFTNGSGDTTYNYVSLLVYLLVALVATIIWSAVDRKRSNYDKAFQWLIVLVKYYIIYQMLMYGLAKLFYLQFQPPRYARLVQNYGDSSPMGILWTFMGLSKGYTIFSGAGEFIGAILLLFRRTRTLGALVVFGVMANVMALNYFYDVPVKILSTHLVLLSLFLILLDGRRLWNLFVANQTAPAASFRPLFDNPKYEKVKNILKWIIVIGGLSYFFYSTNESRKTYGPSAPKPPLHGLYLTESFALNGQELAPLTTDSTQWKWLAIDWNGFGTVQMMNDKKQYFNFVVDTTAQTVAISPRRGEQPADTLYYSKPDTNHLLLEGVYLQDSLRLLMKSKKKTDFRLVNRGFHWINEYPFNR